MDTNRIERLATEAVRNEANKPGSKLVPDIKDGDRGISFDGGIEVYTDDKETKESFNRKVPVQVKGTLVTEFSSSTCSFSLDMEHYRNYLNEEGVLFFVVEIKSTGETKIFYKQFLTQELYNIVKYYGDEKKQKSRVMVLRPLSETTLYSVCKKFLNEKPKQPIMIVENEEIKDSDFQSFQLTSLTFNPHMQETQNIFEHDFFVYGVRADQLQVSLHHMKIDSIGRKQVETLQVEDKEYCFSTEVITRPNETIRFFENVLKLSYKDDGSLKFSIEAFKTLEVQLRIIPFLLDIIQGKVVRFKDSQNYFQVKYTDDMANLKSSIEDILRTLERLKVLFEERNISKDIVIDGDYEGILDNIELLEGILLDRKFPEKDKDYVGYGQILIGNRPFLIFKTNNAEKEFIDPFSKEMDDIEVLLQSKASGEQFKHSPYSFLDKEMIAKCINIDFKKIQESFDAINLYENEFVFTYTNDFCLSCISAYDISKRDNLLDIAEYIYAKYDGNDRVMEDIITVNRCQIQVRKNKELTEEMVDKLTSLRIRSDNDNFDLFFCISVLLGNKVEANYYRKKMSKQSQDYFQSLPIHKIYEQL